MKSNLSILKLVYPPVSNQEAEWLKDDPEVREVLQKSHLYAITQKHEIYFQFDHSALSTNFDSGCIEVSLVMGVVVASGKLDLNKLCEMYGKKFDSITMKLEFGEKLIRFWEVDEHTREMKDVVGWFTVEKFLYDIWRKHPAISGFTNYKEFTDYKLHYVGISKQDDSLTRLVIKPHDKRIRVLSNENTISDWARLTDEVVLLFFMIEPLQINVYEFYECEKMLENVEEIEQIKLIADAEKALVKILNSEYNTEKYKNYPKGVDGLFGSGLDRYGYMIGEPITLRTESESLRGGYVDVDNFSQNADLILISGDDVNLHKYNTED